MFNFSGTMFNIVFVSANEPKSNYCLKNVSKSGDNIQKQVFRVGHMKELSVKR